MKDLLKIGFGNSKLSKTTATFSIPAGWTCPFANECLSKADKLTGKIQDGPNCKYRCYAASQECTYPTVRNARWYNFNLLNKCKSTVQMVNLIIDSLPRNGDYDKIRIHTSGDFFNEKYFLAWLNTSILKPEKIFYGYTKAIPFVIKYKNDMPPNFRLTCSFGGTHDHLISKHNLKSVKVVFSMDEAKSSGLEIDHDDSHAYSNNNESYVVYLHGVQPAKSFASKSMSSFIKEGWTGYGPGKHNKSIKIKNTNLLTIPSLSVKINTVEKKSLNFKIFNNKGFKKTYAS